MAKHLELFFSRDINILSSRDFKGFCIHIVCESGSCTIFFNQRNFSLSKSELAIISRSDLLSIKDMSEDFSVRIFIAPFKFLYAQLPANHYGIGGCVRLFDNPIIPLHGNDMERLLKDFDRMEERLPESSHEYYSELMGSLALTTVYDMFSSHVKRDGMQPTTDRAGDIVKRMMAMLENGSSRTEREVSYYADKLNVSSKYLSSTVKRITGRTVSYLIGQYTMPIVKDYLNDSSLSLLQIADEMNFKSASYFTRYVTKLLGMSPSSYRTNGAKLTSPNPDL